jgi:DNA repair protein RadC
MIDAADKLIADALAALNAKMKRDGLPRFHDAKMAVVNAALRTHGMDCEVMLAYWLDRTQRLLSIEEIARGSEDTVTFSRAHVARRAVAHGANMLVMIHNHPSGDPTPSEQDIEAADRIDRQMAAIDVMVLGHFSISHRGFGDIRTGTVTYFKDITTTEQPVADAPRCPHCYGSLETPT